MSQQIQFKRAALNMALFSDKWVEVEEPFQTHKVRYVDFSIHAR